MLHEPQTGNFPTKPLYMHLTRTPCGLWWVLQGCGRVLGGSVCVYSAREGGACSVAPIPLECAPQFIIGHFQISSFFHVFYPLIFFLRAGWPYDSCRTDTMLPLGPFSSNKDTS